MGHIALDICFVPPNPNYFIFSSFIYSILGAAGIISFGGQISVQGGERVTLPCLAFGDPHPSRKWIPKSLLHNSKVQTDGSLLINNAQKIHQRNYTCKVENQQGSAEITYNLRVIGK